MKHSKQGTQTVLDGSKFLNPSSVIGDFDNEEEAEEAMIDLFSRSYDLNAYMDDIEYESYEELENKLFKFENGFDKDIKDKKDVKQKNVKKRENQQENVVKEKEATESVVPPSEELVEDDDLDKFFED